MIPQLFAIGPFPINSFGLMVVLALVSAYLRLAQSLEDTGRFEHPRELAERLTFWAGVGGIVGARLTYLLSFPEQFLDDPIGMIMSGAGFVFYGGFFAGAFAVWLILRKEKIGFLEMGDLAGPPLAIAYAVGRLGCQLSGDGDYGTVTQLPWAMGYPLGVIPTPLGVLVHPTPVYESFFSLLVAFTLIAFSRRGILAGRGQLFGLYLVLAGFARFWVEFLRIEPQVLFTLTQAQVESIVIVAVGLILIGRRFAQVRAAA